jgi:triacylglycerol lipase
MTLKAALHRGRIAVYVLIAVLIGWAGLGSFRVVSNLPLKPSQQTIVLVHGLLNKPFVMNGIAKVLRDEGYPVYNWGYPSTAATIEEHAASLHRYVKSLPPNRRIHFVGYSQGAIVIRYMVTHYRIPHEGRIVMIGPPNHGSELAEYYFQYGWFRMLYGHQSIKELFPDRKKFFESCGIPRMSFGIIAGGAGDSKGYSDRLPGDDDGMVSVESARLEGATDFILLRHRHLPLILSKDTAHQTLHFIQTGKFDPSKG